MTSSRSLAHSGLLDGCSTLWRDSTPSAQEATRRQTPVSKAQGHVGPVERHPTPRSPTIFPMTFRGSSSWTDMRHTRTLSRVAPSYASGRVPSSLKPPSHSQRVKRPPCLSWGQPLPQNLQMDLWPLAPIWLMHPVCSPRSDPGITNQNHKLAPLGHSFVLLLATPHGFWEGSSIPGPWTSTGPQPVRNQAS